VEHAEGETKCLFDERPDQVVKSGSIASLRPPDQFAFGITRHPSPHLRANAQRKFLSLTHKEGNLDLLSRRIQDGLLRNRQLTRRWKRAFPIASLSLVLGTALEFTACGGSAATATPSHSPTAAQPAGTFGPTELALNAAGDLYVSDCYAGYVYRVGRSGQLSVVSGTGLTGVGGLEGEGGPAIKAQLACPYGLAFDRDGELVIADHANNRIRRIGRDGIIHTIAGSGPLGSRAGSFAGDGGPAIQANLQAPVSVLFDGDGNLYIGDRDNGAIRKVTPDGTITTSAGIGTRGYAGDGGPATRAQLDQPEGMVFDTSGDLYFADSANNRIRKIDTHGIITTFAGTGVAGYSGDGAPASKARMQPDDLVFDPAGNLYIAEFGDHVVRVVDPKGTIKTVAGTGTSGCSGYGGPAAKALLTSPLSPVFDGLGNLFFADGKCGVVLRIDRSGTIRVVAGSPQ
jgi:sugar lactone lactonase YvrE